jgi:hypothetical protein
MSTVAINWIDFIQLNDITYLRRTSQSVPLKESNLSLYDESKFEVAKNVHNPGYMIKNGDAAFLEAGTPVYSLSGYSPYFRLVVRKDGEIFIYEADTNLNAKKGSDLLDIGGKVESIGTNSKIDGKTELLTIKDQAQIDELVRMILDAPVDQVSLKRGSDQRFLEFHLKDGTITKRPYWLDTGILERGIQLPEEFGARIRSILSAPASGNTP